MRDILRTLIEPEQVDIICPPPTGSGDVVQSHGLEGIQDPRDRVLAETAVHLLQFEARRGAKRYDKVRLAELSAILGRNGCDLIEKKKTDNQEAVLEDQDAESSAA